MSGRVPGEPEMSVEEFEELSRRAPELVRLEFIGGKVRAKPPADGTHGQVVMWLMKRCREHRPDLWLYPACGLAVETYRSATTRPFGAVVELPAPVGFALDTEKLKEYAA